MSLVRLNPRHPRSPKNLLLNDVFTDWDSGYGIFSFLNNLTTVPWSDTSAIGLDIAYHGEHSGQKFISPVVYKWIDDDGDLSSAGVEKLVAAIKARYYQKWEHLWAIYTAEYNPLNTYNITESGERSTDVDRDTSNTRTPNLTIAQTGTDTLVTADDETNSLTHGHITTDSGNDTTTTTHGHVITDAGDPTSDTTNQVMGFNSADFVDQAKSSTEAHTDNTQTHSGIDTDQLAHGMVQTNSGTDTSVLDKDETATRTLNLSNKSTGTDTSVGTDDSSTHEEFSTTKQGTMYRAPAELLSLDRDFWLQDFFTIVFADVDDMLTLDIYSERTPSTKIF